MSLPGQVEGALSSAPGFDTDTTLSFELAQEFFALGYKFCLRYLSLGEEDPGDLSLQEATDILNSGLALMPVQHVRKTWSPTRSLGQQDGENATSNAQSVGFPAGVNVWCDLEEVSLAVPGHDVMEYCRAWYFAVEAAGYVPGLYVGGGSLLTGQQLFDLPFEHYWRSGSVVPDIPNRSYQLLQFVPSPPIFVGDVQIDLDVTQDDNLDGRALWLRVRSDS